MYIQKIQGQIAKCFSAYYKCFLAYYKCFSAYYKCFSAYYKCFSAYYNCSVLNKSRSFQLAHIMPTKSCLLSISSIYFLSMMPIQCPQKFLLPPLYIETSSEKRSFVMGAEGGRTFHRHCTMNNMNEQRTERKSILLHLTKRPLKFSFVEQLMRYFRLNVEGLQERLRSMSVSCAAQLSTFTSPNDSSSSTLSSSMIYIYLR